MMSGSQSCLHVFSRWCGRWCRQMATDPEGLKSESCAVTKGHVMGVGIPQNEGGQLPRGQLGGYLSMGKKGSDIPHLSPARLCCSNCICKYLQFAPGLQHPLDSTHWYSYFMAFLLWSVNCVSKLLCLNCLCHIQVPYNKTKAVEPRFEESAALILTFVLAHLLQLSTTAVSCQVFLCTCYPNVQQNSGRWRSWLCHASSSEFGYSLVIQDNRLPNDTHQIARFGSLNRGPPKNSWETFEPSAISKQSYG